MSCIKFDEPKTGLQQGWVPIYISKNIAFTTSVGGPETLVKAGKMYLYNQYIFVTDQGRGVHIINNSDPNIPVKLAFISIPGVHDVAVKGSNLYADNFTDLLTFDISNVNSISLTKRLKDIYPIDNQLYPEFASGYFECADTTKGYIIRWEKAMIENPKCYR